MGLGPLSTVDLKTAREKADKARRQVTNDKLDPLDLKRGERGDVPSFQEYAEDYIGRMEAAGRPKKPSRVARLTRSICLPKIGAILVDKLTTDHVEQAIKPIWKTKNETAQRVRGRIETILSAATAGRLRTGDNPAAWSILKYRLPDVAPKVEHYAALPYAELPAFMVSLDADTSDSSLLLQFTILTAVRYNEAATATWAENR